MPLHGRPGALRSKRLLALMGDERLVDQVRAGSEVAFEVAYERHAAGILSFCRHMLRSHEEAEDAVQQVFSSAYNDLLRDGREIRLKPWLYTIARNRCLSMLRARREAPAQERDCATEGLSQEVERRAELRELLGDLRELPEEQRAALVLSELADLSHAEIGDILDCEVAKVKGLVFRARSGLIGRRQARETPCAEIREKLASLSGGALRRTGIRDHLRGCSGCREFRAQVKAQRRMLATALPVVPPLALKSSVLGAVGLGGGGAASAGLAGLGVASGPVGAGTAAKILLAGVLVTGGTAVGNSVAGHDGLKDRPTADRVAKSVPRPVRPSVEGLLPKMRADHPVSAKSRRPGHAGEGHQAREAGPGGKSLRAASSRGSSSRVKTHEPSLRPGAPARKPFPSGLGSKPGAGSRAEGPGAGSPLKGPGEGPQMGRSEHLY